MQAFVELYQTLDESNRTNQKVQALIAFFQQADAADAAWAIALLTGRRPKRPVKSTLIRQWAQEAAGIPAWLFDECYQAVGDMSETITLLTAKQHHSEPRTLAQWMEELAALGQRSEDEQRACVTNWWQQLNNDERFVLNKLMGGSFRVGVSDQLVVKALAVHTGIDERIITHRLMGKWQPDAAFFAALISTDVASEDHSRPYPFCLAYALDSDLQTLGDVTHWLAEWKWDGIRAQLIHRNAQTFIWTRGEELVTERYPELQDALLRLPPGTVLDGELMAYHNDRPMPFQELQKRIGRKTVSKKMLTDIPVHVLCYDILEHEGTDVRHLPLLERRQLLQQVVEHVAHSHLHVSPVFRCEAWSDVVALRNNSRDAQAEGLMLKHVNSGYQTGRKRGEWWKWKIDPFTADAVLVYAQSGTGRRAGLYTDYTFALRDENGNLVTFAKAYSGLTDLEIKEVDAFIRANTLEKFGPVRTVKPALVFELAFEGIALSSRHKSGIAVRFPRISRWRKDKTIADADTIENVKRLISLPLQSGEDPR
jgi:DNA ligase-1